MIIRIELEKNGFSPSAGRTRADFRDVALLNQLLNGGSDCGGAQLIFLASSILDMGPSVRILFSTLDRFNAWISL